MSPLAVRLDRLMFQWNHLTVTTQTQTSGEILDRYNLNTYVSER